MLIYTTGGTIESNTEHFTRIQELFFPVSFILTQSVLQAHSSNVDIEHSTSLISTLIHLSNTLQYAVTIPLHSVFQLPCFAVANTLPCLSALLQLTSLHTTFTFQSYLMPQTFPHCLRELTTRPLSF
jgi:hypothetical protein